MALGRKGIAKVISFYLEPNFFKNKFPFLNEVYKILMALRDQ